MNELHAHALLAACCTLLAVSTPSEKPPAREKPTAPEYGVRGMVEKVAPGPSTGPKKDTILGYVTVTGKKEADTETDKAVLIVTRETKISRRASPKPRPQSFADLKVGERVQAKFRPGPRILIYPPRVPATEILILGGPAVPAGRSLPPVR